MINVLKSAGVLNRLEGKEAVVAADLRTSAKHALWSDFNEDQVRSAAQFTRRLLREKLGR